MKMSIVAEPGNGAEQVRAARPSGCVTRMSQASCPHNNHSHALYVAHGMVYAAAIILLVSFFAPLWHYNFTAPLYPEYPQGLPLTIYINRLGGRINLINGLNHYIGMAKINGSDFRVLHIMPWLVALLAASGVIVATWGQDHLWPLVLWLGAFAVIGLALLGDFYWWLYAYGNNLDPHAAIRIAPFTPHLFGSYTILATFRVMTWPGIGGIAMMASFGLGFFAFLTLWLVRSAGKHPSIEHAQSPIGTHQSNLIATAL